jgi:hypothetical protein
MDVLSILPAVSVALRTGRADGRTARIKRIAMSPYLRVGLDDYAKGFREGFFSREADIAEVKAAERSTKDSTA